MPPDVPKSGPFNGWTSIWVGDFTTERDLDEYIGDGFAIDHGTRSRGLGESVAHPAPLPLEALLRGFPLSDRWLPAVLEEAKKLGIEQANCAFMEPHYRHVPRASAPGPMRFLASVPLS